LFEIGRYDGSAARGAFFNHAIQHVRQGDVDAVERLAGHDRGVVDAGDAGPDDRELVRILERDGLEIRSGLADGELVVTAGVRRLSDGERVKVAETPS